MIRFIRYITYILLGFGWIIISGSFTIGNYLIGVLFSYIILAPFKEMFTFTDSFGETMRKLPKKIWYVYVLFREIFKSSFYMMYKILQPKLDIRPGIIAYPFETTRSVSTTLLANTISVTPGTLIIDVHVKNPSLKGPGIFYVHSIYIKSPKAIRDNIKEHIEKPVAEAFE